MKYLLSLWMILGLAATSYSNPKIQIDLQQRMTEVRSDEQIPIYILFNNHLTLNDFADISYDTPKQERRRIVIERLQNYANNYQRDIRTYLDMKISQRDAGTYEALWINNCLILKANSEVINDIANDFSNVLMVCYDRQVPIEELRDVIVPKVPFNEAVMRSAINPGIISLKVDLCWAQGNKGAGILVANADDGFWWKHPDVVNGIWQNLGEDVNNNGRTINIVPGGTSSVFDPGDVNGVDDDGNGKIDDLVGWDFTTNNYNITTASHGTATLSQVIGDGTMGNQTGVAPLAKTLLMRNASGQTQQWAAFQYAVSKGADIITSSLSWKWPSRPDYSQFRIVTDMSLAAGTVHTNSTSNDGNGNGVPLNISTAGNCPAPWLHPDQLKRGGIGGVLGTANINVSNNVINSDSPYGFATWGNWSLWGTYSNPIDPAHRDYPHSRMAPIEVPDSMGLIKPDIASPGQNTVACYVSSGTGYGSLFGGTSSATPHTAGVVALMLSINPEMLPADVAKVIQMTAVEMGDPGKDYRYGAGKINAYDATNSPKFLVAGINSPGNMVINTSLAASDTARELAGLKISTSLNPQVGSLKMIKFGMITTATGANVTSFDLYFDKDKSGLVSAGDIKIGTHPFTTGPLTFDNLKFKFLDTARTIILAARTTGSASGSQTVTLGLMDTSQVVAYYNTSASLTNFPFGTVTGTGNTGEIISYSLGQNYPNPFNPETQISYSIAKDGFVRIKMYDVLGKQIGTLINGFKSAGSYKVELNANNFGMSSGIYYYKIESGEFNEVRKMILVK